MCIITFIVDKFIIIGIKINPGFGNISYAILFDKQRKTIICIRLTCKFRTEFGCKHRISILKECGFNAVRIAHHPASQITLDVGDEVGMYVMNETFEVMYESMESQAVLIE